MRIVAKQDGLTVLVRDEEGNEHRLLVDDAVGAEICKRINLHEALVKAAQEHFRLTSLL